MYASGAIFTFGGVVLGEQKHGGVGREGGCSWKYDASHYDLSRGFRAHGPRRGRFVPVLSVSTVGLLPAATIRSRGVIRY